MADLSVAVLAGGMSRRMGMDKAFVPFKGKPLIAHVIERLRLLNPAEILIISREPERFAALEVRAIDDLISDQGPVGGLLTALTTAVQPVVALVACDMPFANAELFTALATLLKEGAYDAVVPRWRGQAQPLHAVYDRGALPKVSYALESGQRRLTEVLDALYTRTLDESDYAIHEPTGLAFANLNTPDDLRAAAEDPKRLLLPRQGG